MTEEKQAHMMEITLEFLEYITNELRRLSKPQPPEGVLYDAEYLDKFYTVRQSNVTGEFYVEAAQSAAMADGELKFGFANFNAAKLFCEVINEAFINKIDVTKLLTESLK